MNMSDMIDTFNTGLIVSLIILFSPIVILVYLIGYVFRYLYYKWFYYKWSKLR